MTIPTEEEYRQLGEEARRMPSALAAIWNPAMTTQTMIKKMATELAARSALHPGSSWEDMARAALQALREPTEEMLDVGALQAWNMEGCGPSATDVNTALSVHHAMIDAALQEKG